MDKNSKLRLPIAIVKVSTSEFNYRSEVFLDTTRDKFLERVIEENEFRYKKKFDQIYKRLDENDNVSEGQYISHGSDPTDPVIDLFVSFKDKLVPMFPPENEPVEEDLEDEIDTVVYENWLHGSVQIDRKNGFLDEYTLAIVGEEGKPRESNKQDFIDHIRINNAIKYQKEFLQKSKILDKYNHLVEAVYETADNSIEILIRFEIKDLKCRVSKKEILEDDHLIRLDKVA